MLLQSLVRLGCVVVLVLGGRCLGDHVDIGLAAVTDCCELLMGMAWWLGSLLVGSWVEVSTTWLGYLFESVSYSALALIDLHTDCFLIWFTLQLLVLLGFSGVLEHVCVDFLHHKVVCQHARLALELCGGLGLAMGSVRAAFVSGGGRPSFLHF